MEERDLEKLPGLVKLISKTFQTIEYQVNIRMWKRLVGVSGPEENSPHSGIPGKFHVAQVIPYHHRLG